jgi:hypothetical protein
VRPGAVAGLGREDEGVADHAVHGLSRVDVAHEVRAYDSGGGSAGEAGADANRTPMYAGVLQPVTKRRARRSLFRRRRAIVIDLRGLGGTGRRLPEMRTHS